MKRSAKRISGTRAGLNEREAPGKVVTARPPKRFAQLPSVSHTLVSTLQKHRSKTSKLIRFGNLHIRDNWGWPCTVVRTWLICSNMPWWDCSSLMSDPFSLHRQVAKLASGLFYCWSLLRNNKTAINPQTFTSSYGSGRFAACDHAGIPLSVFSTQICFFSRPGCLGLMMENRVKSGFLEVINSSATSMCSII